MVISVMLVGLLGKRLVASYNSVTLVSLDGACFR